jgi:hypothetical protein
MKVVEYKVASGGTPDALVKVSNDLIKGNYQPIGGISCALQPDSVMFCQAFVKYEEKK